MKPYYYFAAVLLLLAGCVSPDPKRDLGDLQKLVVERTGHSVSWMTNAETEKAVGDQVSMLLNTNLTAESAVSIALLNNRELQATFEEIGISRAELAQATRLRNPEIAGSWRFPLRGAAGVNAEYSIAQDFLDLLMLPRRKKVARQNLEQTKLRIASQVLELRHEVQKAFYTIQAQHQVITGVKTTAEVNEAAKDLSQRQYDAGTISDLDLHLQQTAYVQIQLELAKLEAQARLEQERFNRLLGLSGNQIHWQILDQLPLIPETELNLEGLESKASGHRLDLAAARGSVLAFAEALKLKKDFRNIPGLKLGVDAEHELDHSWVLGPTLDIEIPIFDRGEASVKKLEAEYRRAQRSFEALTINIASEIRAAKDNFIAARNTAKYCENVLLPQRQRILGETLLHYNAMQKSNFELLAAKEREQAAEREAVEALRDYWIAKVELEQALGTRLETPIPQKTAPGTPSTEGTQSPDHNHTH